MARKTRLGRAVAAHMEENREAPMLALVARGEADEIDRYELFLSTSSMGSAETLRRDQALLFRLAARVAEASEGRGDWSVSVSGAAVVVELVGQSPIELANLLQTFHVVLDSPTLGEPDPRMPNACRLIPAPKEVLS